MWKLGSLTNEKQLRVRMIVDMGLGWSAMMRVFDKGSKKMMSDKIADDLLERIFNCESKYEFDTLHNEFCEWGIANIRQTKTKERASYGQIAKTLDVVLKVAIYYSHLPDWQRGEELCGLVNAAVDNAMMRNLRKQFRIESSNWPDLKDVIKRDYLRIQKLVKVSIRLSHNGSISCPEWDDIHWQMANR